MLNEVVKHQRAMELDETSAFVKSPEFNGRKAKLPCQVRDGGAGVLMIARYEDDATASVLRRIACQYRGGQLVESLDDFRARKRFGHDLITWPLQSAFARATFCKAGNGAARMTMSASNASAKCTARIFPSSSLTNCAMDSGPRLLATATLMLFWAKCRARAEPTFPEPMIE